MSEPQDLSTNPLPLQTRRALLASALSGAAALAAWRLTPTQRLASLHGELNIESSIPKAFGDWQVDESFVGVVNPQQEQLLKQLYSQILTRSYVNRTTGERVMLSIAYGNDQRDGLQLHYPEICYPAQGFQLLSNRKVDLQLAGRTIPARQLETAFGRQRFEPVTYWTVIGETAVRGGTDKKLAEMRYGFRGLIPDGLLFRVSSIDRSSPNAFALQQRFADGLLSAVPTAVRGRFAGVDHIG